MTHDADIAIVGSGFAGSILAMIARRLGHSVVLLERGHHPRFAIGESSTPLASLLLEDLARRYDLPRLLPFTKYGAWRRAYPEVACGLKRGFSFFRHDQGARFSSDAAHRDQLLVAASPNDDVGDVHWYRSDLDHFLVREAVALGVAYFDRVSLSSFSACAGGAEIEGVRRPAADGDAEESLHVTARFVVDATGPRGFLHGQLQLGERPLTGVPRTQALFTHFTGVRPFAEVASPAFDAPPPYPVDAAAVHHVFDGGWVWVLRFDNGITSAGVAATEPLAAELGLSDGAAAWSRLMTRVPSIGAQFAHAQPTVAFTWWPRLAFQSDTIVGDGWAMLPSAAGIVDPLLSTGFPLTLLGIERIAAAIADDWGTPRFAPRIARYGERTAGELATTARLVGALYDAFGDWERFTALSHLYFAAASFGESARRLALPAAADDGFLLGERASFATALGRSLDLAQLVSDGGAPASGARPRLFAEIARAIAPVNVAGLSDPARRHWYPCLASDLLAGAPKLGASERDVTAMLARCGFTPEDGA